MADPSTIFGQPLARDPRVALPSMPPKRADKAGPQHKVQFVIELVGPRSVPAAAAAALLGAQWFSSLGEPEAYAMAPADNDWKPLTNTTNGSYDSLALAWDLISPKGELTSQAAAHLFRMAESFGSHIQRRAMPLPPPADINRYVTPLRELADALDIGLEIMLIPKGPNFTERGIWVACAALGLDLGSDGFFELRAPGFTEPLLTVTPMGGADAFSLTAVQAGVTHAGLMMGFSVPRSPDPTFSLAAAFQTTDYLCQTLNAAAFNDADQMLGPTTRNELTSNLNAAVRTLSGVGIEPGSQAAMKLFR